MSITYGSRQVGEVEVFYREAGPADGPVVVLLHGFPTASHMFRELIPILANDYRVIAPDLPGFGNTVAPPRGQFDYTFDNLAAVIDSFLEAMQIKRYALYIFDYGAPVGLRIATKHPERVTAVISQNGNAYLEGFGASWGVWQAYWREPTAAHREPAGLHSMPTRSGTGSISIDPTAPVFPPTATRSTSLTWHARDARRCSLT